MSTPRPSLGDALLRRALARRAAGPSTSAELLDAVLAAVETRPQRRGSTLPLVSELRLVPILLLLAVLLSAFIGLAILASGRITPPGSSGLVAYESGGDIYVGDPATGETKAIVTGPAFEAHPIFSPDGTHITLYRSPTRLPEHDPAPPTASILVVRADGSDERVIVPAGFPGRALGGFSWTPDSTSLVVNHDLAVASGGLVSLFDASGVAEPRLLTPPLPRAPGAYHPQIGGEVAPMFRPPTGDRILSVPEVGTALIEMDIDGSNAIELIDPERVDLSFRVVGLASWSPDAAWIAFEGLDQGGCLDWQDSRMFVMRADGSDIRRLTHQAAIMDPTHGMVECSPSWSPDGSMILIDRRFAEDLDTAPRQTEFAVAVQFVVVDVATGVEREITRRYVINGRQDPYPHWEALVPVPTASWSPDGQQILVFEGRGTRPLVIDVETGASTRLPWEADSHPSWRFVTTADAR